MKHLLHDKQGFTLTELIVTIIVTLQIMLIVTSIFLLSQSVYRQSNTQAELSQNGRIAIDRMTREIRQAMNIVTVLPASEIMFEEGHDQTAIDYVRYYQDGTQLKRQEIFYYFTGDPTTRVHYNDTDEFGGPQEEIADEKVIAEYVTTITFSPTAENAIHVFIELIKTTEIYQIQSVIAPRND